MSELSYLRVALLKVRIPFSTSTCARLASMATMLRSTFAPVMLKSLNLSGAVSDWWMTEQVPSAQCTFRSPQKVFSWYRAVAVHESG